MIGRTLLAMGVLSAGLAWASPSHAQSDVPSPAPPTCPTLPGGAPALATRDPAARLRFIQGRLQHEAPRMRLWTWGWGVGFGALAVGAGTLSGITYALNDRDIAVDQAIGGGAALVGVGFVLVTLQPVMADQRALDARIAHQPPDADPCVVLAEAERLFLRDAGRETDGRAWWGHVLGIAFNLGVGAILGAGLGHWATGGLTAGVGIVLSELRIWTQPTTLIDDLARYRTGDVDPAPRPLAQLTWTVHPLLEPNVVGLGVAGTF